jgi:hypothetical protein
LILAFLLLKEQLFEKSAAELVELVETNDLSKPTACRNQRLVETNGLRQAQASLPYHIEMTPLKLDRKRPFPFVPSQNYFRILSYEFKSIHLASF